MLGPSHWKGQPMRFPGFVSVALVIFAMGCANPDSTGPALGGPPIQLPAPEVRNGVRVEATGLYWSGSSVAGLSGVAVNESGHDLRMCIVYFDVLNAQGEKVADAMASTNGLKAGATWRFQAVFMAPFAAYFKRIELSRIQAM